VNLESQPVRRRRGAELEDALLEAAWDELFDTGYAGLTFDGVAQRAGTSRPVIYRRWPNKPDLVRAAVQYELLHSRPTTIPDTGTLRGDLLAVLSDANQRRAGFTALLTYHLGPYFQETGTSPAELRQLLLEDQPSTTDLLLDRAIARGEIEAGRLTPRIRSLPYDLFRHEALMTLKPVPDNVIEAILDEIVLPLVQPKDSE
jgi:AcrR family transcriptional regulator